MKKSALLLASVLLAFTGCGRGWLPFCDRGTPCVGNNCAATYSAAPLANTYAANGDCTNCGNAGLRPATISNSYGSGYDSSVIYDNGVDLGYDSGVVVDGSMMNTIPVSP
jgi:hypothetical protein